jgi:hypothetical protein
MPDHHIVAGVLLRAVARVENLIRGKQTIHVQTNSVDVLITLSPIGDPSPDGTGRPIEECILEALGSETLYAREIAEKAGYSHSSHLRETLASMVKDGRLQKTLEGYRRA